MNTYDDDDNNDDDGDDDDTMVVQSAARPGHRRKNPDNLTFTYLFATTLRNVCENSNLPLT